MRPYRIVSEHDDHMVVHVDGESKPFKVAIGNKHHNTVQKIRKYAKGGEVPQVKVHPKAPYVSEYDPQTSYNPDATKRVLSGVRNFVAPKGYADGGRVPNPDFPLSDDEQPGPNAPDSFGQSMAYLFNPFAKTAPEAFTGAKPPLPATGLEGAETPTDLPAGQPAPSGPGDLQAHPIDTSTPMQEPGTVGTTPAAPQDPATQIQGFAEQQAQAVGQKGSAEQEGMQQLSGIQEQAAKHIQEGVVQGQQVLAQRMQHQEDLFNAVASEKIDPNRLWSRMGTGQKIAASIGLILGGIGAGLTKGPNYAFETIQNAINRDIEAQRLNLGKSQNLLSHYMQQTRDLQSAQHLARADYLTSVAAQIAAAQAKMGSTVAIPASQMAIAQIRQQAVVESQAAVSRGLSIREQQINLALSQQHATALGELLKGVKGGGGFDRRLLELPGMDKYRERSVDMPDGSVAFANDKEEANKANESMAGVAKVRAKLSRYRDLLNTGNPVTIDRTVAKSQRADILSEMGHLHSLSRLSDRDLKLFEDQVPDLTDLIKPNAGKRLDALGNSIDDVVWSYNKAILHRPNAKRPGGRP